MSAAVVAGARPARAVRDAWQAGAVSTTTRPGGLLGRWSEPQKFDAYTRGSLYLVSASEPVLVALAVAQRPVAAAWVVPAVVLTLAHTVACVVVLRAGLARASVGTGPSVRQVVALVALGVATVAVLAGTGGWGSEGLRVDPRTGAVLVVVVATLGALSPLLRTVPLLALLLGAVAAVLGVRAAAGATSDEVVRTLLVSVSAAAVVLSYRASAWTVAVVWELERARVAHARLAVAEERLRFSRDLHDVVGRALTAVAVKSELAAELAYRGRDGAGGQMLEVRDLAHDTLREVRAVVEGYRAADLAAELVGARSVLRSAGVEVRVTGEDVARGLPAVAAEALAWAVREGTTNVVRHADARTCELALVAQRGGDVLLRVANDGVRARPAGPGGGAGLRGLTERLAPLGGAVSAATDGDRFVLEVRVPAVAREVVA